ncbi:hypothetical protein C8J48_2703 [Desmospora activa DSM 45169]|uniref:Uncharacterized protein n=1 Tax=Desmospora activa DSM 45169 TaxID=1121389 RepID=A0A2T4ZDW5_9BACL|nr:hypothetical protein C8J48_2703 [Desmospora activa DSM 45169]
MLLFLKRRENIVKSRTLKPYIGLMIILNLLLLIGCDKENQNLSEVKGLLIYGNWESYLYANTDESLLIQIPIYDFSKELEGYSVNVENFDIGEVTDIKMVPQNKFDDFEQYTLEFSLIPKKVGIHKINDLTIVIDTGKNKYEEVIGKWTFEVDKPDPNDYLTITGGSLYEPWTGDYSSDYEYRSDIANISEREITLKHLSVKNDNIKVESAKNLSIKPDAEGTLTAKINISDTTGNVYLRPKLTYSMNGKTLSYPANLTMYASTVPMDELRNLLHEKKMLDK